MDHDNGQQYSQKRHSAYASEQKPEWCKLKRLPIETYAIS